MVRIIGIFGSEIFFARPDYQFFKDKEINFLNSPIAFSRFVVYAEEITIKEAREIVSVAKTVSYIGHEATAKLISRLLNVDVPVNRGTFIPSREKESYALVFRLKKRLEKPEDVQNVTVDDLELLFVQYIPLR